MKNSYILSILACCIFAGLSSITHAEPVKETPVVLADLTTTKEWRLSQFADQAVAAGAGVTLIFGEEGKLSGSGGVNRYGGQFELKADGQITIQNIFSTKMASLDADVMKLENQFFQQLAKAKRAVLSDAKLVIECEDTDKKQVRLVFVAGKKE